MARVKEFPFSLDMLIPLSRIDKMIICNKKKIISQNKEFINIKEKAQPFKDSISFFRLNLEIL